MNVINSNLIHDNWMSRYNSLDYLTQKKIDELSDAFDRGEREKYQLIKIKRSYKYPENGDVFILQPRKDLYLYGLVINAHIKNSYGDAMNIVAIFKLKTHEFNIDEFTADYSKLMLFPIMVARNYWTSGFFYNVGQIDDLGNVPSYGFYHHYRVHKFWNEYGEKINEQPDYLASGATTIIGVGYKVNKEIIIDKSLLK